MKRTLARTISLMLVFCLLMGSAAYAAGRAIPFAAVKAAFGEEVYRDIIAVMWDWLGWGFEINGVRGASVLEYGGEHTGGGAALKSFSLAPMPAAMGLTYVEDFTNPLSVAHPIVITTNPYNAAYTVSEISLGGTDKASIVYVQIGAQQYPILRAQKPGWVTLTVKMTNGKTASRRIYINTMVKVSSLSVYEYLEDPDDFWYEKVSGKTVTTGDVMKLHAVASPSSATYGSIDRRKPFCACEFTSGNNQVAAVDGAVPDSLINVYAKAPGRTNIIIRATDGGGARTSVRLAVKGRPVTSILLKDVMMQPGATIRMPCTVAPDDAWDPSLTWWSDNKRVATVDAGGNVTGIARGTCRIYCRNRASGQSASASATVEYARGLTQTDYFLLGIGNYDYDGTKNDLPACENDLDMIAEAYGVRVVASGNADCDYNLDASEIVTKLKALVANPNIGPEDVTIFYYSGLGNSSNHASERGALVGVSGDIVTVDEVQKYLDQVPGTVILILDSCLSGQFIESRSASSASGSAQAGSFNQSWVSKLASSRAANFTAKVLTGSPVRSKYKILTACGPMEASWAYLNFGWFTSWLGRAIGMQPDRISGDAGAFDEDAMLADASGDGAVTLAEAYRYIRLGVQSEFNPYYRQTVSVWPANDPTALFNMVP